MSNKDKEKENIKNTISSLMSGMSETAEKVNNSVNNDNNNNNTTTETTTGKKSNRGRKKAAAVDISFKGKKAVITKKGAAIEKSNKTFYLEKKYLDILDELESKTGVSTSELVQIAIQLLETNLELEGFDSEEEK